MSYEAKRESATSFRIHHHSGDHYFALEEVLHAGKPEGHGIVHRHLGEPKSETLLTRMPYESLQSLLPLVARYAALELYSKDTNKELDALAISLRKHIDGINVEALTNLNL